MAAQAAVMAGGWPSCGLRSAARIAAALSAMWWRRARLSAALTWARVSLAARITSAGAVMQVQEFWDLLTKPVG